MSEASASAGDNVKCPKSLQRISQGFDRVMKSMDAMGNKVRNSVPAISKLHASLSKALMTTPIKGSAQQKLTANPKIAGQGFGRVKQLMDTAINRAQNSITSISNQLSRLYRSMSKELMSAPIKGGAQQKRSIKPKAAGQGLGRVRNVMDSVGKMVRNMGSTLMSRASALRASVSKALTSAKIKGAVQPKSTSQPKAAPQQSASSLNKGQSAAASGDKQSIDVWGGITSAIQSAASMFKQMAAASDDYVNSSTRLGLISDQFNTQAELQDKVHKAALRSRTSYYDTVSAVTKLGLTAGDTFKGNDEMIAFTELMQKSFAMSGKSASEQQNGINQFVGSMSAGKLDASGFQSLQENASIIAQAIASFTGKSMTELEAMSAQGDITADLMKASMFSFANEIESKFGDTPRTFESAWSQIKDFAIMSFSGIMQSINGFLNSDTGAAMVNGIMVAISMIADAVTWLFGIISGIGTFIQDNWSTLQPLFTQIAIAVGVALVTAFTMWAFSAIVAGISAILSMSPVILIAFAIGLAIGFIIIALNQMGMTFDQIFGFVGGLLGGIIAVFYNLVADIWNLLAVFGEFFATIFDNPIKAIGRLFYGLADVVLGLLETIANAIDGVFGSNLTETIKGWRGGLADMVDSAYGESTIKIKRMEKRDTGQTIKAGSDLGSNLMSGISDKFSSVSSMFEGNALDSLGDKFKPDDKGAAGLMGNNSKINDIGRVGEVGKIKDDVNIGEEDLQLLKDVAEMRYVQNFVTLTPTIAMEAQISERVDVVSVLDEMERRLENEIAMSAEGIFA